MQKAVRGRSLGGRQRWVQDIVKGEPVSESFTRVYGLGSFGPGEVDRGRSLGLRDRKLAQLCAYLGCSAYMVGGTWSRSQRWQPTLGTGAGREGQFGGECVARPGSEAMWG